MRLLQKYKVLVPPDTLRYFRAVSILDSVIVELYPNIELKDIAGKFRNISLANLIAELPSLMTPEKFDVSLVKWLNIVEKEMV